MSTTQKRGFRLPWSSDRAPDDQGDDAERLGELLHAAAGSGKAPTAAGSEDLGEGPFRNLPGEPADGVTQWKTAGKSEAVVLESVVDHRAAGSEAREAGSAGPAGNDGAGAWPTTDRHDAPAHQNDQAVAPTAAPSPSAPRRENPLVAGLVKAMREAAETSRSETIAALHEEATTQVEAVRSGATEQAERLRQQADDDIAGIREWAKTEIARIKQDSEQQIVDRRETLEQELDAHARDVDAQAAQVEDAVAAYEAEMETFFEQLLAESDPARLATLAEHAPEPPILTELPAVRRIVANLRDETPAADTPPAADTETGEMIPAQAELEAPTFETAAADESGQDESRLDESGVAGDLQGEEPLGPEAAAAAEAEAFEGLGVTDAAENATADSAGSGEGDAGRTGSSEPWRQRVIVTGLATVAGISAFKSALGQLSGVQAVSVMAGDPGTFVFTVTHDPEVDLRAMLPDLSGFDAQLTADDGETFHVLAQEPAA